MEKDQALAISRVQELQESLAELKKAQKPLPVAAAAAAPAVQPLESVYDEVGGVRALTSSWRAVIRDVAWVCIVCVPETRPFDLNFCWNVVVIILVVRIGGATFTQQCTRPHALGVGLR